MDSATTFVLGAGFSVATGFPLMRSLLPQVIEYARTSPWSVHLQPGNGDFAQGQFFEGISRVDPHAKLGFEELLIALRQEMARTERNTPCTIAYEDLRHSCAGLFFGIHDRHAHLEPCYTHFASRLRKLASQAGFVAVVSLNWDLVIEMAMTGSGIDWSYSRSRHSTVPILKPHGSFNWRRHLKIGLSSDWPGWQPIAPGSQLCFNAYEPLSAPREDDLNPQTHQMLFPGDPDDPIADPDQKLIWDEVAKCFEVSSEIVIIGYSVPQYDEFFSEFINHHIQHKNVTVVNPSAEHVDRLELLIGKSVSRIHSRFEDSTLAHA